MCDWEYLSLQRWPVQCCSTAPEASLLIMNHSVRLDIQDDRGNLGRLGNRPSSSWTRDNLFKCHRQGVVMPKYLPILISLWLSLLDRHRDDVAWCHSMTVDGHESHLPACNACRAPVRCRRTIYTYLRRSTMLPVVIPNRMDSKATSRIWKIKGSTSRALSATHDLW